MKIGFFGVGHMGGPMAVNLVEAGHQVKVFDLLPDLVEQVVKQGAQGVAAPKQAAEDAEMIISMLPSSSAVRSLYFGEQGIAESIGEQALVIDCSTIDADTSREMANRMEQLGRCMIDAPVSGGVGGAKAGTLTFICGGREEDINRAKPVLENMGKNVFRAGEHGAGQVAKLCNNMLLAIHMTGTCEALQLGVDHGLDPQVLSEIMLASSGRNWSLEVYNPWPEIMQQVPSSNDYEGGFAVNLMNKDLRLAMEAALQTQSSTPLGALAKSLYAMHANQGYGQKDFSSILKLLAGK